MSKFTVIDVETANPDYSSICQIGVAEFDNGVLSKTWVTLVNPEDYFDGMNVSIHQITEKTVKDSPTFPEIYKKIKELIENQITLHHMPFDKVAINRACEKYGLEPINADWLDSARIVRRTWDEFSHSGYGLKSLANFFQIEFKHHDALEDSIATGKIVLKAIVKSETSINDWIHKIKKPIKTVHGGTSSKSINMQGNPDGPLYGENIVFTGKLFITRAEAATIASDLGCNVSDKINNDTTILVVGTQDNFKLAGYSKSSKHRKVEDLIKKGVDIKILSEDDFKYMIRN